MQKYPIVMVNEAQDELNNINLLRLLGYTYIRL
ncbi:hypothetical protein NIES80_05190 [Dolichospermum planctonicum]|uniref:Uncharacterized protein n=1 Tax=Dolichospermum planctonicum TaxID=136072 RepID=A0A480A6Z8_9CYAN|nr:hypothetical protein NIES80_05190 [Dolichospermum planctonicum]